MIEDMRQRSRLFSFFDQPLAREYPRQRSQIERHSGRRDLLQTDVGVRACG
jgi:hypothetical protein